MIVFRETGLVEVSGNILTESQFLSSIKVILHHSIEMDIKKSSIIREAFVCYCVELTPKNV